VEHYGHARGWMDDSGLYPRNWKLYLLGMRRLERRHAQEQFRNYDATFIASANREARMEWVKAIRATAGWE
jgi:hypothetical protein